MLRTFAIALAVAAAAAPAGCGKSKGEPVDKDPGPTCEQVTENLYKVARIQYPGHGEEMAMGDRKKDVAACEARKYTKAERQCMVAAKSFMELAACRKAKPGGASDAAKPGEAPGTKPGEK